MILRRTTLASSLVSALLTSACSGPPPTGVSVRLSGDARCRVDAVGGLALEVLPDGMAVAAEGVMGAATTLSFSSSSRMLGASITSSAGPVFGAVPLVLGADGLVTGDLSILALPLDRPCALFDPEARLPDGASFVADPRGAAWILGGAGSDGRRVVAVSPGRALARVISPGLFNATRDAAAALASADEIALLGGRRADGSAYLDTYELVRIDGGPARRGGVLQRARADASAFVTASGILLVGGRDAGGLVADVERVDVDTGVTSRVASLLRGRRAPLLVPRGDGGVFVVGGTDLEGRFVTEVERLDVASSSSTDVGTLPEAIAVSALVDGRVAVLEESFLSVVEITSEGVAMRVSAPLPAIREHTLLATSAGLVVEGRRDAQPVAWTFDEDDLSSRELEAYLGPRALAELADGTLLELDDTASGVRRLAASTSWSAPPTGPFDAGAAAVWSGDDARSIARSASGWVAQRSSTLTLAGRWFDELELELVANADVRLELHDTLGMRVASCTGRRLRRDGAHVTVDDASCATIDASTPVRLAMTVAPGTELTSYVVRR